MVEPGSHEGVSVDTRVGRGTAADIGRGLGRLVHHLGAGVEVRRNWPVGPGNGARMFPSPVDGGANKRPEIGGFPACCRTPRSRGGVGGRTEASPGGETGRSEVPKGRCAVRDQGGRGVRGARDTVGGRGTCRVGDQPDSGVHLEVSGGEEDRVDGTGGGEDRRIDAETLGDARVSADGVRVPEDSGGRERSSRRDTVDGRAHRTSSGPRPPGPSSTRPALSSSAS